MAELPLFVYGTLRVGFGNYVMLAPAATRVITGCKAPGKMYYAGYEYGGIVRQAPYPCVRFTEEGTVEGDLVFVPEGHPALQHVHDMEFGAGYVLAELPVTTPEGEIITAYGYHWPDDQPAGDPIEHGDFHRARGRRLHAGG